MLLFQWKSLSIFRSITTRNQSPHADCLLAVGQALAEVGEFFCLLACAHCKRKLEKQFCISGSFIIMHTNIYVRSFYVLLFMFPFYDSRFSSSSFLWPVIYVFFELATRKCSKFHPKTERPFIVVVVGVAATSCMSLFVCLLSEQQKHKLKLLHFVCNRKMKADAFLFESFLSQIMRYSSVNGRFRASEWNERKTRQRRLFFFSIKVLCCRSAITKLCAN